MCVHVIKLSTKKNRYEKKIPFDEMLIERD